MEQGMEYRRLGSSGLVVSAVGFGGWGIGGATAGATSYGVTDDGVSARALARALDLGITFYDTSAAYGDGRSEMLIGQAFRGRRDRVVIATKAGYERWDRPADFRPDAIRRSVEASLRQLGTDYIDLLQLHNVPVETLRDEPAISGMLEDLRRAGMIRACGVSVKSPDQVPMVLRQIPFPVVQVNLNMLDVRAVTCGLLDPQKEPAAEHAVGIIARTPLCFGFLSGRVDADTVFAAADHRSAWSRSQIARWDAGGRMMRDAVPPPPGQTPSQMALRFCLSFPAVATVIPGILTPAEAEENAAAGVAGALPEDDVQRILQINRHESFFVPPLSSGAIRQT
jgi:aryl-alcohol dehydrogenase-like predicted oxidoreductase